MGTVLCLQMKMRGKLPVGVVEVGENNKENEGRVIKGVMKEITGADGIAHP